MELDRDQLIDCVRRCNLNNIEESCKYCTNCYLSDWDLGGFNCHDDLANEVISRLEADEQKIKELTEDVDRVSKQCAEIIMECDERDAERLHQVGEYTAKVKELSRENEMLTEELAKAYSALDESINFYCSFAQSKIQNCPIDDEVAKAKTDTIHKMQSMIKEECLAGGIYPAFVARVVENVGKKLLEGKNDV